jgi:RNA ligase (TIGR02306 family)
MSIFSVPVVRVGAVSRHPNADTLSLTEVRGCPVVLRTGSFVEGDLAVYVPVDAVVDTTVPELAFLAAEGKTSTRIRAKRLRGTFSMGLLVPAPADAAEGDDLAERLRIAKWEEPEPVSMAGEQAKAPEGLHVPVYELESLRTYRHLLQPGETVYATEKLHGTNARFLVDAEGRLHVGSHRTWKKVDGTTVWARVAREQQLAERLSGSHGLVWYGEIYGSGVQDMTYGHANGNLSVRFFDVFDAKRGYWLDAQEAINAINARGLDCVPPVFLGRFDAAVIERLAEEDSIHGGLREGVVVRPLRERLATAEGGATIRTVLKHVSQRYLLRKGGTEHH